MSNQQASIVASIGHYGFWGYSASFDFLDLLSDNSNDDSIDILLIGPNDIRHIITTIAKRRRHCNDSIKKLRPINFYILESPIEILARDLLLLEVLLDFEVPIRQRATIFLELFGNSKVQDRTSRYIEQLGHEMRSLVSSGTGRLEGIVDLSLLKYRERDEIENCFKSYSRNNVFDMTSLRDHRLRGYYGERYDSRAPLADWDYHTSIKPYASIIHIKQYKEWRVSGIAFEFGDQEYTEPNRTMMSYAEGFIKTGKEKGQKKEVKGFWGDIVISPYFSFGIDCETNNKHSEGLFEIINKNTGTEQHRHHVVEIATFNLFSLLWEIETGKPYRMTKNNDIYSGLGAEDGFRKKNNEEHESTKENDDDTDKTNNLDTITEGENENEGIKDENDNDNQKSGANKDETSPPSIFQGATNINEDEMAKAIERAECIIESLDGIKIYPLYGTPSTILNKERFAEKFDSIFISARSAQCLKEEYMSKLLKRKAKIAVETSKFLVPLNKEQKAEFDKLEEEFCDKLGFHKIQRSPVFRRHRDENDILDDVHFFVRE